MSTAGGFRGGGVRACLGWLRRVAVCSVCPSRALGVLFLNYNSIFRFPLLCTPIEKSPVEAALPPPPLSVVVDGVMWEHNLRSKYHQKTSTMDDDFKGKYVIISNSFYHYPTETYVPELNSIYLQFGEHRRNHRTSKLTAAQSEFISERYGISTTASTICYSYVQPHDTNLAPCIVGDKLTLALCKPILRRVASVGDVLIAWGSSGKGNQTGNVKYVISVDEKVEFANYMDLAWNRPDQIYTRV